MLKTCQWDSHGQLSRYQHESQVSTVPNHNLWISLSYLSIVCHKKNKRKEPVPLGKFAKNYPKWAILLLVVETWWIACCSLYPNPRGHPAGWGLVRKILPFVENKDSPCSLRIWCVNCNPPDISDTCTTILESLLGQMPFSMVCHSLGPGKAALSTTVTETPRPSSVTSQTSQVWLGHALKMKNASWPKVPVQMKSPMVMRHWYINLY